MKRYNIEFLLRFFLCSTEGIHLQNKDDVIVHSGEKEVTAAAGRAFFQISLSCLSLFLCRVLLHGYKHITLWWPSSELGFFFSKIFLTFIMGK